VPLETYVHHQFGFVKAGSSSRAVGSSRSTSSGCQGVGVVEASEGRGREVVRISRLSDGLGMFHHAAYVRRGRAKMLEKISKHSHRTEF